MASDWEVVVGLEIHVQLATRSKIFSGASTAYGAAPNSQACPVDLALPGVLPVLNREAVRMAVMLGLALGARINPASRFDRKNYFYPDLPKGYQISQFDEPIVGAGTLELALPEGGSLRVGITRAHLEEDAGKSLHEEIAGMTAIDLNRAGVPLLEIVTEPDMASGAQAAACFRELHTLVRYLGICDGNLNQGSMRCDANVSIRPRGDAALGERTEIKNMNSFRFLEQAIDAEVARQIDLRESGGEIVRETLLFDPERNETRPMRSKELSHDYRYFPEPDLLPLVIDEDFIEEARALLPELPNEKRARYRSELGLGAQDAAWLTAEPDVAAYFEAVAAASGEAKLAANWVMGELSGALNREEIPIGEAPVTPEQLAGIIARIRDETISTKIAKTLFETLWQRRQAGLAVDALIEELGLVQMSDTAELEALVAEVIAENPAQVEQYRAGKEKVLGYFVGQIMKRTGGKANPRQLNALLRAALTQDPPG